MKTRGFHFWTHPHHQLVSIWFIGFCMDCSWHLVQWNSVQSLVAFFLSYAFLFVCFGAGFPPQGANNKSNSNGNMSQKKTCPFCFQQLSWHALSRHIRDMHRNKQGCVNCKFCGKVFRNKNSLGCHMWRFHRDQTGKQDPEGTKSAEDPTANGGLAKEESQAAAV